MKSLSRSTPDVRMSRSSGGQSAVNMWSVSVCSVMVSMSMYEGVAVFDDVVEEVEEAEVLDRSDVGEPGGGVAVQEGVVERETMVRIAVVISSREV